MCIHHGGYSQKFGNSGSTTPGWIYGEAQCPVQNKSLQIFQEYKDKLILADERPILTLLKKYIYLGVAVADLGGNFRVPWNPPFCQNA